MAAVLALAFVASLVLSVIAGELLFHPAAGAVYLAALGLLLWNHWRRLLR